MSQYAVAPCLRPSFFRLFDIVRRCRSPPLPVCVRLFLTDHSASLCDAGSSPPPLAADCYSPNRLVQPSAGDEPQPTAQQPAAPSCSIRPATLFRPPPPLLPLQPLPSAPPKRIQYLIAIHHPLHRYTLAGFSPDTTLRCNILLYATDGRSGAKFAPKKGKTAYK